MGRTMRFLSGAMALAAALLLAQGCEPRKQLVRQPDPQAEPLADPVKDDPSFQRPEEMQGFFKKDRRTGTLSSTAKDIETDLGVLK